MQSYSDPIKALAAALLALVACIPQGWAYSDYPEKPVRIVIGAAPGDPNDILTRVMLPGLSAFFKQRFIVDNHAGASGNLAALRVAKAPGDGHTLLVVSIAHAVNPWLYKLNYDPSKSFVPVAPILSSQNALAVNNDLPAKSVPEFIALAKSKPGQLNYASSGPGTPYHMAGELFKAMSGTDIVHVPHKASGDARNSVVGGHVQMMFDAITVLAPNAREGKVVALGTSGKKRSTVMPEVPTIDEAGVPGYESTIWLGVMAPAKTPQPIVDLLNAEIRKIMARPEIKDAWGRQGAAPMTMTPPEFEKYLRGDIAKWAKVVSMAGLVKEK
jgi:tripartite-type tricarboxylate transporter receptor subunit TctC